MDQATRAVVNVARTVLADLELETVLERVLQSAREVTGARYAALGVLDESRMQLARFLTLGIDDATRAEIGSLPRGRGVLGELIGTRAPLRIRDVSEHPRSYGFPAGHPPMTSFLGVPIMVGGEPFGNLYLTDKEGGVEFTDDDEEAAVLLAEFAGVAIDHARRFTSSEDRRVELQRTVDALDATLQIARALGGETNLDKILELVAKRGRALVSASALVIELLVADELVVAAGAGDLPVDLIGAKVPLAHTVASAAIRSRQTQRLSEELNRSRFEQHGLGHLGLHARDGLVVPLIFRNQTYGVLVAVDPLEASRFGPDDERLLVGFAASAATAVATAQSVAEERSQQRLAAAEAERTRWARELHDETLQALANLCLMLAAAQRAENTETMRVAIREVTEQIESDIANLRALITDLRPAALDELGIAAALAALAERVTASGLEVALTTSLAWEQGWVPERLTPELEAAIYRIVQESLTNARRHGHASHAVVELVEDDTSIALTIRDDGQGFDPTARVGGFGLAGMHERVELLGGTITITSSPGSGATISVTFPPHRRGTTRSPDKLGTVATS